MDNLITKAKIGVFWVVLDDLFLRIYSVITNIILARILLPEDFGLVAIVIVTFEMIKLFGNLGIGAKLIQQQEDIYEYATSAFWLNIILSLSLLIITVSLSPYIALFYDNDLILPILIIFSLTFFIQSFGSTHLALLTKELAYKKIVLVGIVMTFLSRSLAIGMAFAGFGVWSLIIPEVIASFLKTIALWIINPWKPEFRLKTRYWKDIFRFGFNYLGADLTRYLNINGSYVIIGKILGERSLGIYSFAYTLANLPFDSIVSTLQKVAFPTFSNLQNNIKAFQTVFLQMTKFSSLVSFPMLMGLFILADMFIPLIYGDKWEEAILPFQIITGFILFRIVASPGGQVLLAFGRADTLFKFNLIQAPFLLIAAFIGSHYGIIGIAVGTTGVLMLGSLLFLYISMKQLGLSLWLVSKSIRPAMLSSAFMIFSLIIFKEILLNYDFKSYIALSILIPAGFVVYLMVLFLFFREDFRFVWNLIYKNLIRRFIGSRKNH